MVRNYDLSPFSGMTRESWIEAGKQILSGVFACINDPDQPIILPRHETEVTYPHRGADEKQLEREKKAEIFEGLARSFLIASVLIAEEPELELNGIPAAAYYKRQILGAVTPGSELYVGNWHDMQKQSGSTDEYAFYQQTVECCALVIGLDSCRAVIFDRLEKGEKDAVAAFLSDYGHAPTVPNNWRLFNMIILAFLSRNGYEINEKAMADHVQAMLGRYAGDGWYRDGRSFDYYNSWAFQLLLPLWNEWYGREHMPQAAQRTEENSLALSKTFGRLFGRNGHVNMWGRSCIYRNAATAALAAVFTQEKAAIDPGWARRICSGALLQFIERDDLSSQGVPSLGFYGQFMPLVQGYSCAASPLWLGNAFLCLRLPADHPFWTAKENEGDWERLQKDEVLETVLPGPGLAVTNHEASGETVLRSSKIMLPSGDVHGMWNYSKLSYNTSFPWEASASEGGKDSRAESMQYLLRNGRCEKASRANVTFFAGHRDEVLYRRQLFDYDLETEPHWLQTIDLADLPVRYGILRIDRHRFYRRPVEYTLGSYGFPDNGTTVTELSEGSARAIVLEGRNHCGEEIRMAMTVWNGWEELFTIKSRGTNPDSENSLVIAARGRAANMYDSSEPNLLVSQVITKKGSKPFSREDIFPVREIRCSDGHLQGAAGGVTVELKNGLSYAVRYETEGSLSI